MAVEVLLSNGGWVKFPTADGWAVTNDGILKVKKPNGDSVAFVANLEWVQVQEADTEN